MDQRLKTGSLMSKFETSENSKDNEGNSEKPEIVHRCDSDSYGAIPKSSHMNLVVKAWLQYPVKRVVNQQKAVTGCSHMWI